jgi:hypothetical protein
VDGVPVPILPTAACQAGVQLPAGAHRLELRYRDRTVPLGAALSLMGLIGGALLFQKRKWTAPPQ